LRRTRRLLLTEKIFYHLVQPYFAGGSLDGKAGQSDEGCSR
jgi:hypothetical protein